jgi:hypothetical protein
MPGSAKKMILGTPGGGKSGFAQHALQAYFDLVGGDEPVDETQMGDLIADMMHLCREKGWDFEEILEQAYSHYKGDMEEGDL